MVKVVKVDTLGGSPAKINIRTGVMYQSRDVYDKLPKPIQRFIYLHEMGHYVLQSADELEVDRWALRQYIKEGNSPQSAIHALSRVVSFENPEHMVRLKAQLDNARHYDFHFNGNTNALRAQFKKS